MRNATRLGIVFACAVWGQAEQRTASQMQAALDADLHGPKYEDIMSAGQSFVRSDPSPAGVVSVTSLRHKIPKEARKAFERAAKLSAQGNYRGAAKELEKAVQLDPAFTEAHANLGVQYLRLGRVADAEAAAQRAVDLDPHSSGALSNLAAMQLKRGDAQAAEKNARRALAVSSLNRTARAVLDSVRQLQGGH